MKYGAVIYLGRVDADGKYQSSPTLLPALPTSPSSSLKCGLYSFSFGKDLPATHDLPHRFAHMPFPLLERSFITFTCI